MKKTYKLKLNVMMKVGVLLVGAMLTFNASAQAFQNKTNVITLGFGFDPFYSHIGSYGYNYKKTGVGPIILTYERGITELLGIGRIGVGGSIGQSFYTSKSYSNFYNYEYIDRTSRTAIFLKVAYHFDFGVDKLDVYAGVGGGGYIYNRKYSSNDPYDNYKYSSGSYGGGPAVFGGVRYYFTDAFGVYGEVGYGMSAINGGLAFKF